MKEFANYTSCTLPRGKEMEEGEAKEQEEGSRSDRKMNEKIVIYLTSVLVS